MSDSSGASARIAIAIATVGRPELLHAALRWLGHQLRLPDAVYVCAPAKDDLAVRGANMEATVIIGHRGSSVQRNAIIAAARDYDILLFLDDDFFPDVTYLAEIEKLFQAQPNVVVATGNVVLDGIMGPGVSVEQAMAFLETRQHRDSNDSTLCDVYNGYGCNMAVRNAALRESGILFDEKLPLYAWLEDVDFSRRLSAYGRIVRLNSARGIHLGVKRGRQQGHLLGYSQIANPIYLARKGTFSWPRALRQIGKNVAANCLKSIRPEQYIDRRGRLRGHIYALRDLLVGRLHPERVLDLVGR
jgi:GT2 family glycosyltransferase